MALPIIDIANAISLLACAGMIGFCVGKLVRNRTNYSGAARDTLLSLLEVALGFLTFRLFWIGVRMDTLDRAFLMDHKWILLLGASVAAHGVIRFVYVFLDDPPVHRDVSFVLCLSLGTLIGYGASLV
jgi:hypothetical protein